MNNQFFPSNFVGCVSSAGRKSYSSWRRAAPGVICFTVATFGLFGTPSRGAESRHVLRQVDFTATITVDSMEIFEKFGPRFDRCGAVTSLSYAGVEYVASVGLADEFGLDGVGALGFAEGGREGAPFLKVGVGELTRYSEDNYIFWVGYPVRSAFPVEVTAAANGLSLSVAQVSSAAQGYSYRYHKSYALEKPATLVVTYELQNTGQRAFTVSHYNHNWLRFADAEPDAAYRVSASFPVPGPAAAGLTITEGGLGLGNEAKGAYWAFDSEIAREANRMMVRRRDLALEISGDFPAKRFALWVGEGGFCPEIFGYHTIEPGAAAKWRRIYRILPNTPSPDSLVPSHQVGGNELSPGASDGSRREIPQRNPAAKAGLTYNKKESVGSDRADGGE